MCGLAGIIAPEGGDYLDEALKKMCFKMVSRGPDAEGVWKNQTGQVVLGHRRLSVLDLNPRSNQPMIPNDLPYVIVFNGEIYNYKDIRQNLEGRGIQFHTNSDTEVLVKLYALEGPRMLSRLRGMFAIAIWDISSKTMFLARDPYGIKPLYFARGVGGEFLFASQVKSIIASELVSQEPDSIAQAGFWLTGSVPEPRTWFRDISAVPAGSWCKISSTGEFIQSERYIDIGDYWRNAPQCSMDKNEVQKIVRDAVTKSVSNHLVSDVPVGIFLSGGIDSGSLAGLIKDSSASEIHGVTIAFDEFRGSRVDEVPMASEIAKKYGIRHTVRRITQKEFEGDLPKILSAMDQPSIDGINTWYASKAAKELGLKVVISGVGGDELFYGYPSFNQLPKLNLAWRFLSRIPRALPMINAALALYAQKSGNRRWNWITSQAGSLYGAYWLRRGLYTPDELPDLMGCNYSSDILKNLNPSSFFENMVGVLPSDSMAAIGQLESMSYLRNQLLRDCDWASMDHGIELRTPLVDEWLLRDLMPVIRSFGRFKGKKLLSACPRLPLSTKMLSRTKTGFGIPMNHWLSGSELGRESITSNLAQGAADSRDWAKILSKMIYEK